MGVCCMCVLPGETEPHRDATGVMVIPALLTAPAPGAPAAAAECVCVCLCVCTWASQPRIPLTGAMIVVRGPPSFCPRQTLTAPVSVGRGHLRPGTLGYHGALLGSPCLPLSLLSCPPPHRPCAYPSVFPVSPVFHSVAHALLSKCPGTMCLLSGPRSKATEDDHLLMSLGWALRGPACLEF